MLLFYINPIWSSEIARQLGTWFLKQRAHAGLNIFMDWECFEAVLDDGFHESLMKSHSNQIILSRTFCIQNEANNLRVDIKHNVLWFLLNPATEELFM